MKRKGKADIIHNGGRIRVMDSGGFMADYCSHGKRRRKVFPSESHARTAIDRWVIEAENIGRQAYAITDRDRMDVQQARKWLDVPLSEVFDFWRKHHAAVKTMPVSELVAAFLNAPGRRGGRAIERREATTEGHRKRLLSFLSAYGDRLANEVTQADIETWLAVNRWQGLNRRHYLSATRALFAFAMRKGIITIDPTAGIELPEATTAEPSIMPVAHVERYLRAVESECPDLLAREALAFFCGLRPTEVSRLDWRHISLENKLVTIGPDVAKIPGQRRVVEIPGNAVQWLAPYARDAGPVWPYASPTTLVRKRAQARDAASVEVPDNAGRHAFASYHLAAYQNGATTAELLGHSDAKLLRGTYRNINTADGRPITAADGAAYFGIMPARDAGVVRFPGAAIA